MSISILKVQAPKTPFAEAGMFIQFIWDVNAKYNSIP